MKNSIFIKILIAILAATLILTYLIINAKKMSSGSNGFSRVWKQELKVEYTSQNDLPLFRIAGSSSKNAYFCDKDPRFVYSFDYISQKWDSSTLILPFDDRIRSAYDISIDSIGATLFAGKYSAVFKASFGIKDSTQIISTSFKAPMFMRSAIVSNQSAVLRALDPARRDLEFIKVDRNTGITVKVNSLFEKIHDGGFSTDGILRYDLATNRIIYLQFYRNRFFCLDSNLNLLYEAKTIDTTNSNIVFTKTFNRGKEGNIIPGVPLKQINSHMYTSNGYIYIASILQSDNEKDLDFQQNSVIDIYHVSDGKYTGSFYIPTLDKRKITDFYVYMNRIIAIYKNKVVIYRQNNS